MKTINTRIPTIANPNDRDNFNRYMLEISKNKPFSKDKEVELFKELELTGDQKIVDKLCLHNLLFVVSVAKQYASVVHYTSLTLEDLINEGNIGLYLAIKKYDYKIGNKFISFAVWNIKAKIIASINNNLKSIRIPTSALDVLNKSNKLVSKMEQDLERTPTSNEVFDVMIENGDISNRNNVENYESLIAVNLFEERLNAPINDDTDEFIDVIKSEEPEPEDELLHKERKEILAKMLENLSPHIMSYFNDFYGLDGQKTLNLVEMGEKYGMSSATIKQRMDKNLRRIRMKNRRNRSVFFCDTKDIY